ncbi:MAG: DsrE family protein [Alkalilacustris sp.]
MHGIRLAVVAAMLLVGALWTSPVAAEEPHHFVFHITTDEGWTAGSALTQATIAAERGHRVTVLLSVRGIYLAKTASVQGAFGVTARSPLDLLARLIRDGHDVLVCGICLVAGGIEEADLVEGARIAGSDVTFAALTAPDTVVLSY